jgi:regulator of sigma E protease
MTILAFLFVLGVLIFVHELGHFLVARWYGVRVITFSLGFGPKLLKYRRGDTEYCVSAVPLGGYVKLAGETVEDRRTGAPDEFLSKSKWVRCQVYLAGPVMNLLLAFFVLAAVLAQGAEVPVWERSAPVIGAVEAGSPAEIAGLRRGDRIVSVDGRDVATWRELAYEVLPRANRELLLVVERDGQRIEMRAVPDGEGRYETGTLGIGPEERPQITQVSSGGAADRAGLEPGDVVLAVNGEAELADDQVVERIRNSGGRPVLLRLLRDGAVLEIEVLPELDGDVRRIGVVLSAFEVERIDPTLIEALRMSAQQNWSNTLLIGRTLRGLLTRDTPVGQLVGPLGIGDMAGQAAAIGWQALFGLMAMISLNLALLNLLPIPVLDGGHIAILALEGVARRDLSARVKERILIAGAALIVLLMVTVIYNDVARMLR